MIRGKRQRSSGEKGLDNKVIRNPPVTVVTHPFSPFAHRAPAARLGTLKRSRGERDAAPVLDSLKKAERQHDEAVQRVYGRGAYGRR